MFLAVLSGWIVLISGYFTPLSTLLMFLICYIVTCFWRGRHDIGVIIGAIHTNNGVFNSQLFCNHCDGLHQQLSYSGVGAYHQDGVAEHAIQLISNMAHANLIHTSIQWTEWSLIDRWPLAICMPFGFTIVFLLMTMVSLL